MGLLQTTPSKRLRRKVRPSAELCKKTALTSRHVHSLLPSLYSHTQGKDFGVQVWGTWLRKQLARKGVQLPTAYEAAQLLRQTARTKRLSGKCADPVGAWKSRGIKYADEEGLASVQNILGFKQKSSTSSNSKAVSWNEYGFVYRLCRIGGESSRQTFAVVRTQALKKACAAVSRKNLVVEDAAFNASVVIDPGMPSRMRVAPQWTFIYLHSFSNKGTDYHDFPHYFHVSGANLRVVVPTAPQLEQDCFKDWYVWRGERLKWRRIKFNAWFNYLSDKGGVGENAICITSLLAMREKLHQLIRQEVKRVGGDPKRVIIGGASQGCCVALDAAMTFEEELGGVVGLVGHLLGSTPLDRSKRNMPIHLFHEASDKEMRWKWVQKTVERMVTEGFRVTSKRESDPSGSGHWIQEIECQWIRSALRQIIFSDGRQL